MLFLMLPTALPPAKASMNWCPQLLALHPNFSSRCCPETTPILAAGRTRERSLEEMVSAQGQLHVR